MSFDQFFPALPEEYITIIDNMSLQTAAALIAAAFMIVRTFIGYKRGILVETGRLISLIVTIILVRYLAILLSQRMDFIPGPFFRTVFYIIFLITVYHNVRLVVEAIGKVIRKVPVVGFTDGLLGGLFALIWSSITIFMFQFISGINIIGAMSELAARLGSDITPLMP